MEMMSRTDQEIRGWLISNIAQRANLPPERINPLRDLADYALDSSEFVELAIDLEVWLGFEFDMTVLWEERTLEGVVEAVCREQSLIAAQLHNTWGVQSCG